jgi:glutathione S-transferase
MLTVYGTHTSPFVRRVLVVADELGVATTLLDVNDPAHQAARREHSPIWKVPVATWNGRTILDSHAITETLLAEAGPGPLSPFDPLDTAARNAIAVADGAADALINTLYLGRDGISPDASAYLRKQQDRAAAALAWLDARVDASSGLFTGTRQTGFGLIEIALVTAMEWMRFRQTYPIERHGQTHGQTHNQPHNNLVAMLAIHAARPSFAKTIPHA